MTRILATAAALAMTAAFALPTPATAAEKRADGARTNTAVEQTDVSAQRRRYRHRHVHRHYAPRYGYYRGYRAPYYYGGAPYYAYAPRYYQPYYGPSVGVGIGPFGFGFRSW
jgi:Ni/Co efflux regulator RcnB